MLLRVLLGQRDPLDAEMMAKLTEEGTFDSFPF
jgi:hypothetical protein